MDNNAVDYENKNDFSVGSVKKSIVKLAIPLTVAQLINVLYNIVDRIYIGHLAADSTNALSGVGLALPIITVITGFANLFGMGGASLCSIARGAHERERAEGILGTSFLMVLITGALLTTLLEIFAEDVLYLVGAGAETIGYAKDYLVIYLIGTVFQMLALSMNSFINSQGFAKTGMLTVLIGALLNIALDPVFIFVLNMGVKGAAIATVISQVVSSTWALGFLFSKKAIIRLRPKNIRINFTHLKRIIALGSSAFVMNASTGAVQIVNNVTLAAFGDIYIGVMTILNSVREIVYTPLQGIAGGAQFRRQMPRTRPRSNSLPDHSFPGVYNDSMGGNIDHARIRYASVYPRPRIDSRRRAGFEYLLFRVVPGGITIFRSVYLCRGW